MQDLKTKGKQGEELVKGFYESRGYTCVESNYSIWGGEIDILMEKERKLVAIEVKSLDTIDEFDDYITPKKVNTLQKTLNFFLQNRDDDEFDEMRIDVVLVKHGKILEVYEDITGDF